MTAHQVQIKGRHEWWTGRIGWPVATVDPDDFAHGIWGALAVTLAQPLRKALADHLAEHEHPMGFAHCGEAMRLYRLLPDGDQVAIG